MLTTVQVAFWGIVEIQTHDTPIPFSLAYRTKDGTVSNEPDSPYSYIIGRFTENQPEDDRMCYVELGIR